MSVPIINRCEFRLGLCSPAPLRSCFLHPKGGTLEVAKTARLLTCMGRTGHTTKETTGQSGFSVSKVKVTVPPIKSPHTGRRHEQS